jgi:ATP dependent DNA ligase domain
MHPTAARELPADQRGGRSSPSGTALRSRNGVDMAGWFPELVGLAAALGDHAGVLAGEVVAIDDDGRPSFGALQQRLAARGRRRRPAVTYLVFDVLWLDGRALTGLPYVERRRLEDLEVVGPSWQTVASFPGAGTASCRRPGGGSGPCWRRSSPARARSPSPRRPARGRWSRPGPDEPGPVSVRPELAVEVSFLGWRPGRLRHPASGGLTRIL